MRPRVPPGRCRCHCPFCFFLANPGHYWIRVCGPPLSLSRAGDQILAKPAYVVLFRCFKHEPLFQNVWCWLPPNDKSVVFILCTGVSGLRSCTMLQCILETSSFSHGKNTLWSPRVGETFHRFTRRQEYRGIGWDWWLYAQRQRCCHFGVDTPHAYTHRQRYSTRDTHMLQCGKCGTYIFNSHIPNYMNYIPSTNLSLSSIPS